MKLKLLSTIVLLLMILAGCAGATPTPTQPPRRPPTTIPTAMPTFVGTPDVATVDQITIRIEEITLTDKSSDFNINIDKIWLIPLNAEPMTSDFRAEYTVSSTLNATNSYIHDSAHMYAFDRTRFEGDMGLWIIIAAHKDAVDGIDLLDEFNGFMRDVLPFFAFTAVEVIFTTTVPAAGVATIPMAARRGYSMLTRLTAFGRNITVYAERVINNPRFRRDIGVLATARIIDNLENASQIIRDMDYFAEVLVVLPADENYYVNNQLSAVTTDGVLNVRFSVFNDPQRPPVGDVEIQFSSECNPELPSIIVTGSDAIVTNATLGVHESPLGVSPSAIDTLLREDVVTPLYPYCNWQTGTLWWYVTYDENSYGWVQEHSGSVRYLESDVQ